MRSEAEIEHYVKRAAWETLRRLNVPLEFIHEFPQRLDEQLAKWKEEDTTQNEEVAA